MERAQAPAFREHRPIRAAENQPAIGPAGVMVGPFGVPQHHVAEPEPAAHRRRNPSRGDDVGVEHAEASGQRFEVRCRVAGCDDYRVRAQRAAAGPDLHPASVGHDAPHHRLFEHACAKSLRSVQQPDTRLERIDLRVATCANAGLPVDAGRALERRGVEPSAARRWR